MYKDDDFGDIWGIYKEKSTKLCTEEYKVLRRSKVDVTI